MEGRKIGLLAQDVETVMPEVVATAPDDLATKAIWYDSLIPVLVHAIQELDAQPPSRPATYGLSHRMRASRRISRITNLALMS